MNTRIAQADVDGKAVNVPTGADVASLNIIFYCGKSGPANLHAGALRLSNGEPEPVIGETHNVLVGSVVTIRYLQNNLPAPQLNVERLLAVVKKNHDECQKYIEKLKRRGPPSAPVHDPTKIERAFQVTTPTESLRATALLDEHSSLQAQLLWGNGSCTFTVQSVFSAPDGSTTGERYIHLELKPGQHVSVAHVA